MTMENHSHFAIATSMLDEKKTFKGKAKNYSEDFTSPGRNVTVGKLKLPASTGPTPSSVSPNGNFAKIGTPDVNLGMYCKTEEDEQEQDEGDNNYERRPRILMRRKRRPRPRLLMQEGTCGSGLDDAHKEGLSSNEAVQVYSAIIASLKRTRLAESKISSPQLEGKKPGLLRLRRISKAGVPGRPSLSVPSSAKKKVNFMLSKNLEHEHSDYRESIQRSPSVPYDKNKQPYSGLLKSISIEPRRFTFTSNSKDAKILPS